MVAYLPLSVLLLPLSPACCTPPASPHPLTDWRREPTDRQTRYVGGVDCDTPRALALLSLCARPFVRRFLPALSLLLARLPPALCRWSGTSRGRRRGGWRGRGGSEADPAFSTRLRVTRNCAPASRLPDSFLTRSSSEARSPAVFRERRVSTPVRPPRARTHARARLSRQRCYLSASSPSLAFAPPFRGSQPRDGLAPARHAPLVRARRGSNLQRRDRVPRRAPPRRPPRRTPRPAHVRRVGEGGEARGARGVVGLVGRDGPARVC